ncbi:hypothetical protein M413DRAFT_71958, partial [Hebeloma cylindrosporum]
MKTLEETVTAVTDISLHTRLRLSSGIWSCVPLAFSLHHHGPLCSPAVLCVARPSRYRPVCVLFRFAGNQFSFSPSQIRSRVTVCKRLKLKCDRNTPCGSCTKRNTVDRCTYSPAAAEKVDLHSLNNRMIQVETFLAMLTAGQPLPAFQSTYP